MSLRDVRVLLLLLLLVVLRNLARASATVRMAWRTAGSCMASS